MPDDMPDLTKCDEATLHRLREAVDRERERREDLETAATLRRRRRVAKFLARNGRELADLFCPHHETRGCRDDNLNIDRCTRCNLLHLARYDYVVPSYSVRLEIAADELHFFHLKPPDIPDDDPEGTLS